MGRKPHNMKPVEAFKDGVSLGAFENMHKAADAFGINEGTVSKIVNGLHAKTRDGVVFTVLGKYPTTPVPALRDGGKRPPVTVWKKGIYIGTFARAAEASKKTGIDHKTISRILAGESARSDGFSFDYDVTECDWNTCRYPNRIFWGDPVEVWKEGTPICTFSSVSRAERTMSISHGTIRAVCNGNLEKTRRGFVFKRHGNRATEDLNALSPCEEPTATNPTETPPLPLDAPETPQTISEGVDEFVAQEAPETETASAPQTPPESPSPVAQDEGPDKEPQKRDDAPVAVWRHGVCIGHFPDMITAGEAFGKKWLTNPSKESNQRRDNSTGLFFTYNFSSEYADVPRLIRLRGRGAKQAEAWKDGELVCTFGSLYLAAMALKFHDISALHACIGRGEASSGGYTIKIPSQKAPKVTPAPPTPPDPKSAPTKEEPLATQTPTEQESTEDSVQRWETNLVDSGIEVDPKTNSHLGFLIYSAFSSAGWLIQYPGGEWFLAQIRCYVLDAKDLVDDAPMAVMFRMYVSIKLSIAEFGYSARIYDSVCRGDKGQTAECMRRLYDIRETLDQCRLESLQPVGPQFKTKNVHGVYTPISLTFPNRIFSGDRSDMAPWVKEEDNDLYRAAKEWVDANPNFSGLITSPCFNEDAS